MTDTLVQPEAEAETSEKGRKKDRDFTKFRDHHQELAEYVNANSGLPSVTPNQVKAILTLKTDFTATPEQIAARAERKAQREAEKAKYAGLTPEQITQLKSADKLDRQAAKLEARLAEAREKARLVREGKEATGEDLAAAVQSAQNGAGVESEPTPEVEADDEPKRRFGRNK